MIIRINRMGVCTPDPSPARQPEPVGGDASSPEKAFGIVPTPTRYQPYRIAQVPDFIRVTTFLCGLHVGGIMRRGSRLNHLNTEC